MEESTLQPIIHFSHTDIYNNGNLVISDLCMSICKGEFVYIIGKVGSGKTSIIRTIIGEIKARNGEARVAEFNLLKLKNRHIPYLRRKIGVVFQDFQLLMDRSVEENLSFVLRATGWSSNRLIKERISKVLGAVGMESKSQKMPHQLSGGEQQRIAIARALLNDPEIILADEPTGNLDNDTADEILNLLMRLKEKENAPAIIMVTHNQTIFDRYPGRTFVCEKMNCTEALEADSNNLTLNLSDFI